jgi:hypothetical protein
MLSYIGDFFYTLRFLTGTNSNESERRFFLVNNIRHLQKKQSANSLSLFQIKQYTVQNGI